MSRGYKNWDGKPTEAPKTASHSRGGAAEETAQDGKATPKGGKPAGGATSQDEPTGGATSVDLGLLDSSMPGLRAFRLRVDKSHEEPEREQPPVPPQRREISRRQGGAASESRAARNPWRVSSDALCPPWVVGYTYDAPGVGSAGEVAGRGYAKGGALDRAADAGYEPRLINVSGSGGSGLGSLPWEHQNYLGVPHGSADRWITSHWHEGWLIREHRKARKQSFYPVPHPCRAQLKSRLRIDGQ